MIKLIQMKEKDSGFSIYEWIDDSKKDKSVNLLSFLMKDKYLDNLRMLFANAPILSKEEYHTATFVEARQITFDSYQEMIDSFQKD